VNNGWTNPTYPDTVIKNILLQFYTANVSNVKENLQLVAYPGRSYSKVYGAGKTILKIDTACTPVYLSDTVIFANNFVDLDELEILNPNGTLKSFSFIRFIPHHAGNSYVTFTIQVVRVVGGTEQILKTLPPPPDPCPPYCPKS
jgi:hypothetical protein